MRLYENEAKRVFEREGIAVPRSLGVFERAADLGKAVGAKDSVMLKALVLIGGRGKAGGVRRAAGGAEAASLAADMLGRSPEPVAIPANEVASVALIDEASCIGCTHCRTACPVDAITGAHQYMHTFIASECTGCELCVAPCPVNCISMVPAA